MPCRGFCYIIYNTSTEIVDCHKDILSPLTSFRTQNRNASGNIKCCNITLYNTLEKDVKKNLN